VLPICREPNIELLLWQRQCGKSRPWR
jgi:hypothetical protein